MLLTLLVATPVANAQSNAELLKRVQQLEELGARTKKKLPTSATPHLRLLRLIEPSFERKVVTLNEFT